MKRHAVRPAMQFAALACVMLAGAALLPAFIGARAEPTPPVARTPAAPTPLSAMATLGRTLFFDPALSASGSMACASCHDPAHHYAPANDRVVQLGGADLDTPGIRTTPSLTYKLRTPPFEVGPETAATEMNEASPMAEAAAIAAGTAADATSLLTAAAHTLYPKAGNGNDIVPEGGMFWDGRAGTLQEQVLGPFYSPFEMATNRHALYQALKAGYAPEIARLFGAAVLSDEARDRRRGRLRPGALPGGRCLLPRLHQQVRRLPRRRGDADAGRGARPQALRRPEEGQLRHLPSRRPGADGAPPVFTDYEYEALGVPRNPAIPANADPRYFDLGICGPLRHDIYARQAANCGLFKTPTLRNVAARHVFFHNGVYANLADVVRFYMLRETEPEKIYPLGADGRIEKYDDLPPQYRRNIDITDAPFDRRRAIPRRSTTPRSTIWWPSSGR